MFKQESKAGGARRIYGGVGRKAVITRLELSVRLAFYTYHEPKKSRFQLNNLHNSSK
jgi:hypothetical protein